MTDRSTIHALTFVLAHFALACAISWGVIWAFDPALDADSWTELLSDPALLAVKFGPSIAGLIMLALFPVAGGIKGLASRLMDIHKRPRALAGALAFALLAAVAPGLIYIVVLDAGIVVPAPTLGLAWAALFWVGLRTLLGGGLGEELGWRGFALPLLLERIGPRTASLLLGVLWTLWHAPGFFQDGTPWWLLALAQALFTVALSFVFTWFYLRTGGSLSVAILLHGALNGFNAFVEKSWIPALDDANEWQIIRIIFVLGLGVLAAITLPPKQTAVSQTPI